MIKELHAHFPRESIRWRAQTVTKDGKSAMALAYIDARDVMERLDRVCGPEGWQTEHFDAGNGKLGCKLGMFIKADGTGPETYGQWIWKSDGAGATAVEGDKGAFSDAFKRAAVQWGVGRYLYAMGTTWVPCESYKQGDKFRFKKFTDDPWNCVKPGPGPSQTFHGPLGINELKKQLRAFSGDLISCEEPDQITALVFSTEKLREQCARDLPDWVDKMDEAINIATDRCAK